MAIALLAIASFAAWFFSMLAGGGSPLVLIPLISLLIGAQAVAPTITVGLLIGNTQRSLFFWQEIDWTVTAWYLPGAVIGALLGSYAFSQMHLEWLQLVVGIGLLLIVLNYLIGKQERSFSVKVWYFLPISLLNALGSAFIGSTGPIMNPVYLNYGLEKERMVATKSLNKAFLHMVKLLAYGALGVLNWEYLGYGLVIGLAAIPANWCGKQVLERMSNQQFRQAIFTFVAFSGVWMLWQQRQLLPLW